MASASGCWPVALVNSALGASSHSFLAETKAQSAHDLEPRSFRYLSLLLSLSSLLALSPSSFSLILQSYILDSCIARVQCDAGTITEPRP